MVHRLCCMEHLPVPYGASDPSFCRKGYRECRGKEDAEGLVQRRYFRWDELQGRLNWLPLNGMNTAKCPKETIDLNGHSDGSVDQGYAHLDKLPMALLKEGIERLQYADVVKALQ